jgi:hypothetical protein
LIAVKNHSAEEIMPKVDAVTSSVDLSWLAETADGTRDQDLALVKDEAGQLQIRQPAKPGEPPELKPGDAFIVPVRTEGTCATREQVRNITIFSMGGGQADITGIGPDALFWTDSAVEKFLYPYYYSQRIWSKEMDLLREQFSTDPAAIAVLHRAPSTSETVPAYPPLEVARVKKGTEMSPVLEWVELKKYLQ